MLGRRRFLQVVGAAVPVVWGVVKVPVREALERIRAGAWQGEVGEVTVWDYCVDRATFRDVESWLAEKYDVDMGEG